MTDIFELFITFGTQYGRDPERHEIHPLGMTGDGYMVVEAPTRRMARDIAFNVTGGMFAFDYDRERFMENDNHLAFYPEGELLRIAWQANEAKPFDEDARFEAAELVTTEENLNVKFSRDVDAQEISDMIFGTGALSWGWWGDVDIDVEKQLVTIRHDDDHSKEGSFDKATVISFQHLLDQMGPLREHIPQHSWAEMITDNIGLADAGEADIMLQYAVFGKIVYG